MLWWMLLRKHPPHHPPMKAPSQKRRRWQSSHDLRLVIGFVLPTIANEVLHARLGARWFKNVRLTADQWQAIHFGRAFVNATGSKLSIATFPYAIHWLLNHKLNQGLDATFQKMTTPFPVMTDCWELSGIPKHMHHHSWMFNQRGYQAAELKARSGLCNSFSMCLGRNTCWTTCPLVATCCWYKLWIWAGFVQCFCKVILWQCAWTAETYQSKFSQSEAGAPECFFYAQCPPWCVCVPLATPGCTKTFSIEISRTWLTRPDNDDDDRWSMMIDDDHGDGDDDDDLGQKLTGNW